VSEGDIKRKAALSFWINVEPGAKNEFLDLIDPLQLPHVLNPSASLRSKEINAGK